tara:strand:+ start:586 stop:783 length:198 start_codon:yes stop_codon:yes gene_type:complete
MDALRILQSLDEIRIAKLTWVWWYLHMGQVRRGDLKIIFHILQEECGKEAAITFIHKYRNSLLKK